MPRYWSSGNEAEVDFLIQYNNEIFPIEVKSNTNVKSKSLSYYRQKYNPTICIRYSLHNFQMSSGIININLFMSDLTENILTIY